ncbi:MFS transporter [Microbacterium sediminicola]|uniref:MFS transporter n=1 Tax=Microbacterium sediminicola TaxID=415210 RepID=A0ABN2IEN0_9MICO
MDVTLTRSQVVRWRTAVFAVFFLSGLSVATWASRVPALKNALEIDSMQVGFLLFGAGVASIIGLSVAPLALSRLGARRAMLTSIVIFAVGVTTIGIGADVAHSFGIVIVGLALFGLGNGSVDVMMNVEGAAIETETGKTLLPLFHALFSVGTVAGAGLGALAIALDLNVLAHAVIISAVIVLVGIFATANVPSREEAMDPDAPGVGEKRPWRERLSRSLQAWREPRTYGLGLIILGMSFAEGGANDWLALGVVEGHEGSEAFGALGLAVFSLSMTVLRIAGGPLVDRFGRVLVLRVLSGFAAGGLLLFVFAPTFPLILVGAALWGAGVSLGFPLGMSAAADDPRDAAARVSATATIGYVAFLCGPPLLGIISHSIGILNTLLLLVGLAVISGLASGAAKPLPASTSPSNTPAATE